MEKNMKEDQELYSYFVQRNVFYILKLLKANFK